MTYVKFQIRFFPCVIVGPACVLQRNTTHFIPGGKEKLIEEFKELLDISVEGIHRFKTITLNKTLFGHVVDEKRFFDKLLYCNLCRKMKVPNNNPTIACIPCKTYVEDRKASKQKGESMHDNNGRNGTSSVTGHRSNRLRTNKK